MSIWWNRNRSKRENEQPKNHELYNGIDPAVVMAVFNTNDKDKALKRIGKVGSGRYPVGFGLERIFLEWLSEGSGSERQEKFDVLVKVFEPKNLIGDSFSEFMVTLLKKIYPKLIEITRSELRPELERITLLRTTMGQLWWRDVQQEYLYRMSYPQ
jgi:hypothetical protein